MLKATMNASAIGLLGLVARLRSGRLVRDPIEENVGVRLKPHRFAPACRFRQVGHSPVARASPARAQGIERTVGGDPVQPGADRRASLKLFEAAPRGEQRL